ncbi:MAG: HNH endonuclease [Armatimonadota bacterium]
MASTKGHGNPAWNRDETLLALELYFETSGSIPAPDDSRVIRLSETLRGLPFHPADKRMPSFRNPDGVAFKLQNLRHVATGKGLDSTSKTDEAIWQEYGGRPDAVTAAASAIRAAVLTIQSLPESDDDVQFPEGRAFTTLHKRRERNPKLRSALLRARRQQGLMKCEICETLPLGIPEIGDAIFEGHHRLGLSSSGERATRLSEMALLCANCHRALHRAIMIEKRWLSVEEGRGMFGIQKR